MVCSNRRCEIARARDCEIARLRDCEIARLRSEDSSDESDRLDGRPADQIARLRSYEMARERENRMDSGKIQKGLRYGG